RNEVNYLDCFGHHHKINSFNISDSAQIDLLYKNKINDDTYKISVKFIRLKFSLVIEKNNRYFSRHRNQFKQHKDEHNNEQNKVAKTVQAVGVTVGDLIKHFYHNNK